MTPSEHNFVFGDSKDTPHYSIVNNMHIDYDNNKLILHTDDENTFHININKVKTISYIWLF